MGFLTRPSSARTCLSDRTSGRRSCLGGRILFLKQRPIAIERPAVEELDTAVIDLERAERDAAITQAKQIAAHLFFGQPIRRTAIMGGQPTDRVDVDGLGSRRQPRRLHVFNHPQSQRRHRGLPWFEQASALEPAPPRISSTQTTAWRVHAPTAKPFSPTSFMLRYDFLRRSPSRPPGVIAPLLEVVGQFEI